LGDEVLKTLQKAALFLSGLPLILFSQEKLSLGNEVKAYDKIFEKIAEKRIGADVLMIDKLDNPFVVQGSSIESKDANGTVLVPTYSLDAIFDNKAKINGQWFVKNDDVGPYKLTKVTRNSAILQNESEKKELLIRTKDESNIKIFAK
jgi:hypothetical protein